jgi:hypothetical protein
MRSGTGHASPTPRGSCFQLATTRPWHTRRRTFCRSRAGRRTLRSTGLADGPTSTDEKKLAERHLHEGSEVPSDVSSSYYEGRCRSVVLYGNNRDGQRGRPIIVYGVLTDPEGRPPFPWRSARAMPAMPPPFRSKSKNSANDLLCHACCWWGIAGC